MRSISRLGLRASAMIAARIAGAAIMLLSQLALARWLGADMLGIYYLGAALVGVLGLICTLGYPAIIVRFIAEYRASGQPALLQALLAQSRRDSLIATGFALLMAAALIWAFTEDTRRQALLLALLAVPFFVMLRNNGAIANGYRQFFASYLPDLLLRPAAFLICILAFVPLIATPSVVPVMIAFAATAALAAAWQAILVARPANAIQILPSDPLEQARPDQKAAWRSAAYPMIIVLIFTTLFADFDILILGPLLDDSAIAIFGVCLKLALLLSFSVQMIYQLVLPDAADAMARQEYGKLSGIVQRANRLSVLICLAALACVVVLGDWVLGLFGPEFVAGKHALLMIVTAQLIRALAGPGVQILTLAGKQRHLPVFFLAVLGVLIGANFLVVPFWGLDGAAAIVLLVTAVWSGAIALMTSHQTGITARLSFGPPPRGRAVRA